MNEIDDEKLSSQQEALSAFKELINDAQANHNESILNGSVIAPRKIRKKHRRLSQDGQLDLIERAQGGDSKARDVLVKNSRDLIKPHARPRHGCEFDDLFQEGSLGLVQAIERFDLTRATSFQAYANILIEKAIARYIDNSGRCIRMPVRAQHDLRKIAQSINRLTFVLCRKPDAHEIAIDSGLDDEEYVKKLIDLGNASTVCSLDALLDAEDLIGGSEDTIIENSFRTESLAQVNERADFIARTLRTIEPKERQVLELRFGLNGDGPLTLQKIGDRLGITRQRVRKIESQALKKLKDGFSELADGFVD